MLKSEKEVKGKGKKGTEDQATEETKKKSAPKKSTVPEGVKPQRWAWISIHEQRGEHEKAQALKKELLGK